jgi:hypothetical protein
MIDLKTVKESLHLCSVHTIIAWELQNLRKHFFLLQQQKLFPSSLLSSITYVIGMDYQIFSWAIDEVLFCQTHSGEACKRIGDLQNLSRTVTNCQCADGPASPRKNRKAC